MTIQWPFRHLRKLPAPLGRNASIAFDEDGHCHFLFAASEMKKQRHILWRSKDGTFCDLSLPTEPKYPILSPMRDGGMVILDAVCPWKPEQEATHNGVVLDKAGQQLLSFHGGSSIADVQCDNQDRIWISFFDEGVFGNHGWNHPGPKGLGAGGLVCLNAKGKAVWAHNSLQGAPKRSIDDCYALNVIGNEAWFYFYHAFCLGRVSDLNMHPSYSQVPVSGSSAFAMSGGRLIFSAAYRQEQTTCHLVDNCGNSQGESRLVDLSCTETVGLVNAKTLIKGRGMWIHLVNHDTWIAYSLDDLPL